jgi:hypothetical protein
MKKVKRNGVSQRKTDDSFCRTVDEGEKKWQQMAANQISTG